MCVDTWSSLVTEPTVGACTAFATPLAVLVPLLLPPPLQ